MISEAIISDCGTYRYSLTRIWDEKLPKVMFVMLNPSTADSGKDDPTIRRCIGFAKSWGYGGLYVCNLFAYRATNPKELLNADNPFGNDNSLHIKNIANETETIICAWGNKPILHKVLKNKNPYKLLGLESSKLYYLQFSKDNVPKHPLYLNSNLQPIQIEYIVP
jgi:hypothetical protein